MELVSVAVGSVDRVERVECTVERRRLRRGDGPSAALVGARLHCCDLLGGRL